MRTYSCGVLVAAAVTCWYFSMLVVFSGVLFGSTLIPSLEGNSKGYIGAFGGWDGVWYVQIANDGYSHNPGHRSNVNFFPAFPLAGRFIASISGMSTDLSLVVCSNLCFLLSLVVFAKYLHVDNVSQEASLWSFMAFAMFPTTLFFHIAYSEAMFALLAILALYGMRQSWPIAVVASIIGMATATRLVGIALCCVLICHLWKSRSTWVHFVTRCSVWIPLSAWGVLSFTAYLHFEFGDFLLYAESQELWSRRTVAWSDRIWQSIILEPIWSKYNSESPAYWAQEDTKLHPLFSLDFANPIYFVVTVGLIAYGRYRKWIDDKETLFSAGVLAISYFAQGHRFMMMSQGRFAATCFPVYIVMGHLLARMPPPLAALLLALSACMLFAYSALFATWHRIY